jgi:hypothetical protein
VDVVVAVEKCVVLTFDEHMDTQSCCVPPKNEKKRNSWMKTGLTVRDGLGDRSSGVSTDCSICGDTTPGCGGGQR